MVETIGVLIVDDHPAKLTALSAALEGMDIEVVTATSGAAALRYLLAQNCRDSVAMHNEHKQLLLDACSIAESEAKFRKITESAHDGIVMMGSDKCISFWNKAAERIFGYTAAEVIGQEMHPLLAPPATCAAFEQGFRSFQQSGTGLMIDKTHELLATRKGGEIFPIEITISALQIDGEWNAMGIFRDITEHKCYEEKIHQLAFLDELTQLPNRRLLNDRLVQAMAISKRDGHYCALMFIDLDNFKSLNDQHGHEVGDLLLIEVAQRVTRCLRESDTVARFGGDEFIVLLKELDTDLSVATKMAQELAEKILSVLSAPYSFEIKHQDVTEEIIQHRCTASIGVVLFLGHQKHPRDIMMWADAAMYQAKQAGRNQVRFFDPISTSPFLRGSSC